MVTRKNLMIAVMAGWVSRLFERPANAQPPQPPAAQPPKEPQASFEPRTGPGAGQKWMEKSVGNWEVRKTISPPGREPSITKGSCKQTMTHKGLFLRSEFIFEEKDGSKTEGEGILGYDATTDIFTSVWTDSRSTRFSLRASEGKFDGEQVILLAKSIEGMPSGRHSHTVARLEDNGKVLVHRQYNTSADGKEYVIMELYMTRKKR